MPLIRYNSEFQIRLQMSYWSEPGPQHCLGQSGWVGGGGSFTTEGGEGLLYSSLWGGDCGIWKDPDAQGLAPGTLQVLCECIFLLSSLLPLGTEPGSWTEVAVSPGHVIAVTDSV